MEGERDFWTLKEEGYKTLELPKQSMFRPPFPSGRLETKKYILFP